MLRIRKLVLAIAAASALSSGMAHALGLGELTLKSAQNQPLDAEIELLDVRDLTAAEVAPSLAPPEEFAKAGVERQAFLNDLTFTTVINPNGKSVLRVTSSQPLPAPMVKFLVQVMWPSGRLLRDYSVLVDPAKFNTPAGQPAPAGVAPAVTAANYTTVRRDTLWEIASKARQGGSVQQTMLAIQALNPDAFINGNINLLKTGQVLRLPDQQQITSIPQAQAVTEVAEQYAAWREGRRLGPRARQLDATRRSGTEAAPARIANQDNLKLVAPGSKAAAGSKGLSDKLAMAQESLDTSRRDNEELKGRMADLQSQLDKLQRLIALKNDQLAKLEAQGAADAAAPEAAATQPPAISAELQPAPAPAQPAVTPAPAAVDTAPVDPAQPAVAEQAPADSNKMLDDLLGNPLLLALIAGSAVLVLLLLLLLLARKRKADQEAEKHLRMARALAEEGERAADLDLPPSSFEGLDVVPPSVTLAPAVVAASAAAATAAALPAEEPAPEPAQAAPSTPVQGPIAAPLVAPAASAAAPTGDTLLDEVELNIARGRLNHAAELLEPAVAAAPERSDLRLKLMEVYARQGDRDGFVGHERQLIATGQNHADVEALKNRFPAMLAVAGAGVSAAALAAELDAQYVQELLQDEALAEPVAEVEPVLEAEPVVEPEAAVEESLADLDPLPEDDLDSAFDLSLEEDLQGLELDEPPLLDEPSLAVEEPQVAEVAGETSPAQPDFDALLEEHLAQPEQALDDLADFDLDVASDEPAPQPSSENVDVAAELAAFDETMPEFDPLSELDLPEDFDLSLSLDDSEADKHFASELDDVNAELDKLSQSLEQPSIEAHFTEADAALSDDLDDDFDYLGGADEVATKLDLARAYIDMGDHDGARDILDEVRKDGSDAQRQEADELLSRLV
ncbi:FimV/HubP family polar landmark protein [Pseudomonas donghuensis]|uniref:FimV family protein n=1 Tax=Pseudomonas donghuensis TaxID=1163398 RepID=A0AAP0SGN8_9PSED|nr:FimV/HubP family polar landmark protein [Pseudomonas donghuensis]KDN98135.2 FimV family protein [Pseudomonas donghuensis]MCP6694526.1 FimV family protein [Pseudomonas donghuensis]MDF9894609.1 pilus assembly protein FimV [Pseudomonas vranovensis]